MSQKTLQNLEGKSFGWEGNPDIFPGLYAKHFYIVEAIDDATTRFVQTEDWSGPEDNMMIQQITEMAKPAYNDFNKPLKAKAEKS